jgi:AcrR family transcriptional regulator
MEDAFEPIAQTAAQMFLSQGYAAVSLRAVAEESGIQAASLYYHCPGGKSELYMRALERFLESYRRELAVAPGRATFPRALLRMTDWMVTHPPVDLQRIVRVDLPRLERRHSEKLLERLHTAVLEPLSALFKRAKEDGRLTQGVDPDLAAACVLALVDGLGHSHLPSDRAATKDELGRACKDVRTGVSLLLEGAMG